MFTPAAFAGRPILLSSPAPQRSCMPEMNAKAALLAGTLAAIGASICCAGPLVLLALGIGGAWIANLTVLEAYRPLFIGLTMLFLGLAFRKIYRVPQVCAPDAPCDRPKTAARQKLAFWSVAVVSLGLLVTPWLAPLID